MDEFLQKIFSWNFQGLKDGRDQVLPIEKSPEDLALEKLLPSKPPIPDRFRSVQAYQACFARPALQEFQAAAVQAAQTETGRLTEAVTLAPDDGGFVRGKGLAVVKALADAGPWFREVRVAARKQVSAKFPTDYLCVVSNNPDHYRASWSFLGVSSYAPKVSGFIAKLKVRSEFASMLNQTQELYISPLVHMVTFTREVEALASLTGDAINLKTEVILGSPNASARGPTDLTKLQPIHVPEKLKAQLEQRLNESQMLALKLALSTDRVQKFVLVKGPPGTGKTATLHAMLNCMHIQQYQQYYASVGLSIKQGKMTADEKQWLELTRLKPRVLVCAPSNVGIDNIVERIVREKFEDGQGRKYLPTMVRVGSGASDAPLTAKSSLDRQVEKVQSKSVPQLSDKISKLHARMNDHKTGVLENRKKLILLAQATPHIFKAGLETRLAQIGANAFEPYWVDHANRTTTRTLPPPVGHGEAPAAVLEEMEEWKIFIGELTRHLELWEDVYWKYQRYQLALRVAQNGFGSAAEQFKLRESLETMILNRATVVASTLSACGLPQVKASYPFNTLIVDEAAQAVELSTLIPLTLGVMQCVLVGDPQQLPATLLAKRRDVGNYERSLFERLETCGVPSVLLNVQYRMHPAISFFPREVFYPGLFDAPSVSVHQPFFSRGEHRLEPYTFFDLLSMEETVSSGSKRNPSEAQFCVNLYRTLLQLAVPIDGLDLAGRVGIVSPYSEQVKLIKEEFDRAFPGRGVVGNEIEVNTVDAFQGKEKDIIILSTVRADPSSVGFLADVRRMNVAITRAKHGLFVVGRGTSLAVNDFWKGLIDQAIATPRAYMPVQSPQEDLFRLMAAIDGKQSEMKLGPIGFFPEYLDAMRDYRRRRQPLFSSA